MADQRLVIMGHGSEAKQRHHERTNQVPKDMVFTTMTPSGVPNLLPVLKTFIKVLKEPLMQQNWKDGNNKTFLQQEVRSAIARHLNIPTTLLHKTIMDFHNYYETYLYPTLNTKFLTFYSLDKNDDIEQAKLLGKQYTGWRVLALPPTYFYVSGIQSFSSLKRPLPKAVFSSDYVKRAHEFTDPHPNLYWNVERINTGKESAHIVLSGLVAIKANAASLSKLENFYMETVFAIVKAVSCGSVVPFEPKPSHALSKMALKKTDFVFQTFKYNLHDPADVAFGCNFKCNYSLDLDAHTLEAIRTFLQPRPASTTLTFYYAVCRSYKEDAGYALQVSKLYRSLHKLAVAILAKYFPSTVTEEAFENHLIWSFEPELPKIFLRSGMAEAFTNPSPHVPSDMRRESFTYTHMQDLTYVLNFLQKEVFTRRDLGHCLNLLISTDKLMQTLPKDLFNSNQAFREMVDMSSVQNQETSFSSSPSNHSPSNEVISRRVSSPSPSPTQTSKRARYKGGEVVSAGAGADVKGRPCQHLLPPTRRTQMRRQTSETGTRATERASSRARQ